MGLHRRFLGISIGLLACAAQAHADEPVAAAAPKQLEAAPGAPASARPGKVRATFQAQLFVEQKDAPAASKTALRLEGLQRPSAKSKD
jgi:hypothetical protein